MKDDEPGINEEKYLLSVKKIIYIKRVFWENISNNRDYYICVNNSGCCCEA